MRQASLVEIARSPIGRLTAASVGFAAVWLIIDRTGLHTVLSTIERAAPYFPLVLLLEAGVLACTLCGLRLLYGEDRHRIPASALVRAGLVGYSVMGFVPAGRTVAESTRAIMLSRYSTRGRAWAAAARLQGVALLGNAAISLPAALATLWVLGVSVPTGLVFGNCLLTLILGFTILLIGCRSRVGAWLGRILPRTRSFGEELDEHLSSDRLVPVGPFLWEFGGRIVQVIQNGVLVAAVGGGVGLVRALCSEALHLVGAAAGDLIPAQLGATELNFRLSSGALHLQPADALSIALLAHMAQLFWMIVGLLVTVLWPSDEMTHDETRLDGPFHLSAYSGHAKNFSGEGNS